MAIFTVNISLRAANQRAEAEVEGGIEAVEALAATFPRSLKLVTSACKMMDGRDLVYQYARISPNAANGGVKAGIRRLAKLLAKVEWVAGESCTREQVLALVS